MLIDHTHRNWFYRQRRMDWLLPPRSIFPIACTHRKGHAEAAPGIAYGIAGFAFMLFAGLLGAAQEVSGLAGGTRADLDARSSLAWLHSVFR